MDSIKDKIKDKIVDLAYKIDETSLEETEKMSDLLVELNCLLMNLDGE